MSPHEACIPEHTEFSRVRCDTDEVDDVVEVLFNSLPEGFLRQQRTRKGGRVTEPSGRAAFDFDYRVDVAGFPRFEIPLLCGRVIASNFTTGIKSTACHIEIILGHERKSLINLAS